MITVTSIEEIGHITFKRNTCRESLPKPPKKISTYLGNPMHDVILMTKIRHSKSGSFDIGVARTQFLTPSTTILSQFHHENGIFDLNFVSPVT